MFSALLSISSLWAQTNKHSVRTGTPVELAALKTLYARELEIGDNVQFKVVTDVKQDGVVLIPKGTIANGVVTEAKKSTIAGTKGRLAIDFKYLIMDDGTQIPLTGNIRTAGKNRTPLAVITALFVWPCIFIPGSGATLTEGKTATATILVNTDIPAQQ